MSAKFPFFIVGCGRSGTSLLRSLLNRHPQVAIPLESLSVIDYLRADRRYSELKRLLVREPELREWGLEVDMGDLEGENSIEEAIEKLHRMYAVQHGKERWGQKTPRYVRHMELINEHFPESCFIHLVRDPRAVASSLMRSDVHHSNAYYAFRRWIRDVAAGLAFERSYPDRVLRIHYEDLVAEPEEVLKRIAEFLELQWMPGWWRERDEGTVEYSEFYDQIHANLDRPGTDKFIDRWNRELSAWQLKLVEVQTAELMGELGYVCESEVPRSPTPFIVYCRAERLLGLARQLLKHLGERREYLTFLLFRTWKLGLLKEFLWAANN